MARFVRSSSVVSRRVAGELVLVPITVPSDHEGTPAANFYVLNGTGEVLWERLGTPASTDELATELASRFEIDIDTARWDVTRFLGELHDSGAVRIHSAEEKS